MKVIIIEDERLSAEHLTRLLGRIDHTIEVIGYYDSVKRSITELKKQTPCDLLFVDIHLGDGISFEIFSNVEVNMPIVFTTAYDDYAIEAFKLNSVDYLLKPIVQQDLLRALEKFKRWNKNAAGEERMRIQQTFDTYTKAYKSRFMVKMGEVISSIKTEDALYFISEDGLVLLVNKEGRRYPVDFTLEQLQDMLAPDDFFRINRKVLVNINAIQKVSTYFNSRLKISLNGLDEDAAVVSRERVNDFKAWLDR